MHIYLPTKGSCQHSITGHMKGKGIGSVLLDGGMGGQSSYSSIDNYIHATGRDPRVKGRGLGKIASKLSSLNIAPAVKTVKKPISFSM